MKSIHKNVLAKAIPNWQYKYIANFRDVILEARLVGSKVMFYEVREDGREFCLRQETVHQLFDSSTLIIERPFLAKSKDNRDFYAVLNRHRIKYIERFKELRDQLNEPQKPSTKIVRTRHAKIKRTKHR